MAIVKGVKKEKPEVLRPAINGNEKWLVVVY